MITFLCLKVTSSVISSFFQASSFVFQDELESEADELNVVDCKQNIEENGSFKMANQIMNILEHHIIVGVSAQSPICRPNMIFSSLFTG